MAISPEVAHDLAVHHRIGLGRYSNGVVRKVLALLKRTEVEIARRLERTDNETVAGARLEALLRELRSIQSEGWSLIADRVNASVRDLAGAEAEFSLRLAGLTVPEVTVGFSPLPPIEQIVAAVNARPFQGRFLREWLAEADAGAARRVRDAVRQGFIEGRPTAEIVRAIRGTKAAGYQDGILQVNRRGAETMVRTALTHTANVAAQATWEANSDIVRAWRFVATLDMRTTITCASLHGKKFPLGKGPMPPRHPNCRSVSVPVLDPIPGVKPFEFPSYSEWLRKQPAAVQDQILGKSRGALFRSGGFTVDRFTDDKGKVLTLAQLQARDAAGFERAGLSHPIKPPPGKPKDAIARFLDDEPAQMKLLSRAYGSAEERDAALRTVTRIAGWNGWNARPQDLAAIRFYTGEDYGPMNKRLREGGAELQDRQLAAMIARGIADLPEAKGEVWRGPSRQQRVADRFWRVARMGEALDIGQQMGSFSLDRLEALKFAGAADVLFRIRKPAYGAHIEPITLNPGEEEVLFQPGLRYIVVRKTTEVIRDMFGVSRPFRVIELEMIA
ncbi:MAG: phage minor head protein [Pseudomonadota bacterium]